MCENSLDELNIYIWLLLHFLNVIKEQNPVRLGENMHVHVKYNFWTDYLLIPLYQLQTSNI